METGRKAIHYALGDNQDYECEWSKAVLTIELFHLPNSANKILDQVLAQLPITQIGRASCRERV